jgi:hypothetical protein
MRVPDEDSVILGSRMLFCGVTKVTEAGFYGLVSPLFIRPGFSNRVWSISRWQ